MIKTLSIFIVIPLLYLFFKGCSNDKIEPPKIDINSTDSIPSQESFNTTVTFSDSGRVKAILTAGDWKFIFMWNNSLG